MANAVTLEWIEKRSEPELNSGCLLWSGATFRNGYGRARGGLAHRASWEAACEVIPNRLHVLHRCDTPSCVNPDHLFLGTHADNMRDKAAKGRVRGGWADVRGERHPRSKLSAAQVRAIRSRRAGGEQMNSIAADFNINKDTVRSIVTGRTWSHVQ